PDGERPEQPDECRRACDSTRRQPRSADEDRRDQEEADETEIGKRLHVEVLDAVAPARSRERELRLVRILVPRRRNIGQESGRLSRCLPADACDRMVAPDAVTDVREHRAMGVALDPRLLVLLRESEIAAE